MPFPVSTLNIHNLRLRTFIGFNPEEKVKKQDVVINMEISYRTNDDVVHDRVEGALNYRTITKQVIQHVDEGKFLLLEKLAADVLNICSQHSSVERAHVTVDKPHALRFADSVSVSIDYERGPNQSFNMLEKAS